MSLPALRPASTGGTPTRYPLELVREVEGPEATCLHVRPIRPDDGPRLEAFHRGLSRRSRYLRFFSVHPELSASEVERFTHVDYQDRLALVVEVGDDLVAVGRYERAPGRADAEVAFVVTDALQHRGIGSLLLSQLASAAWERGITTFTAVTLAENRRMLDVLNHSGLHVTSRLDHETVALRLDLQPPAEANLAPGSEPEMMPR